MSLSTKVLLGLALGIVSGVFFGEMLASLQVVGDAFIQLLQMTVLPYVVLSLMVGLGSLTYGEATSLAKKCGIVLCILWAMAIAMVLVMPFAFPDWTTASFFSTALVEERQGFNFLGLFIPANPFYSLSNNIVPAVVVFSIAVGVALIGVEKKRGLLEGLASLLDALTRVTHFVINLAPIGVFAIAASAAGTMNLEELGRLQVYLVTYGAVALLLTFWMLPALVTSLTPITYWDVVGPTRDALITAFATGNLLIVLPILAEKSKELLRKYELDTEDSDSAVGVIVPTSFTFPNMGKLLTLSFVLFAGWYSGSSVPFWEYPTFVLSGLVSFFGEVIVAIPFLLDLLRIPADMFQLFVTVDVFSGRFGTLLAAMHVLVLALLGACAMTGRLTLYKRKLLQSTAISVILTLIVIGGIRFLFVMLEPAYTKYQTFVEMEMLHDPVRAEISTSPTSPLHGSRRPRLEVIRERGILRVCYFKDDLPYAFVNAAAHLVGFDIEMAHLLAKDLNVAVEFVRIDRANIAEHLNTGSCDMGTGLAITPEKSREVAFSVSYADETAAFIVRDHRRHDFKSWDAIRSLDGPRIGIHNVPYYIALLRNLVPRVKPVILDSPREFFKKGGADLDAFVYSAEAGSAWTLVYPQYTVVVPLPDPLAIPVAYPMPRGERELVDFVNTWIELKKKDNTIDELFDHWILGKQSKTKKPRWSVIRNVLHLVD